MARLAHLPVELLHKILFFVPLLDLPPLRSTCRILRSTTEFYLVRHVTNNMQISLRFAALTKSSSDPETHERIPAEKFASIYYTYIRPKLDRTCPLLLEDCRKVLRNIFEDPLFLHMIETAYEDDGDSFNTDQIEDIVDQITNGDESFLEGYNQELPTWEMWGKWVLLETYSDCRTELTGNMSWKMHPTKDGDHMVFTCSDNVIPFGCGVSAVEMRLTWFFQDWNHHPEIHWPGEEVEIDILNKEVVLETSHLPQSVEGDGYSIPYTVQKDVAKLYYGSSSSSVHEISIPSFRISTAYLVRALMSHYQGCRRIIDRKVDSDQ